MVKVRRILPNKPIVFNSDNITSNHIYVGFWSTWQDENKFIKPQLLIEDNWENEDKNKIINYLKNGSSCAQYLGWSTCRICRKENGFSDFTDDKWIWPEGLAHYVEDHNVRLPREFINHMRNNGFNIDSFDEIGIYKGDFNFWNNWCQEEKKKWEKLSLSLKLG